jgi:hypothetical protein
MKIFWSWQSDTPGAIGRFLVRDALRLAVERLKQDPEIDEPTRDALHLDHDRQGVPGSPDLVRAILEKIDAAEVVVADVTVVGVVTDVLAGEKPKKLVNSNVATEFGYALRALTYRKVLMVFNSHYGNYEDLPFDFRQRGGAIVFNLAPQAEKSAIESERKMLVSRFYDALKLCLSTARQPEEKPFLELPATFNRAVYFQPGEPLAVLGEYDSERQEFYFESRAWCYLRLLPTSPRAAPLRLADLLQNAASAPVLSPRMSNRFADTNQYGAIGFDPRLHGSPPRTLIDSSTQLTESGELWTISANLVIHDRGSRPGWVKVPCIATLAFEQTYVRTLYELVAFAKSNLGLTPPWQVECGAVGIRGVYLGMFDQEFRGPIRKDEIYVRDLLKTDQHDQMNSLLLKFFIALHDASGYSRPDGFNNFPP